MHGIEDLTERQRACLRAVANHRTYKEIARDLGISGSAVEKHLRHARERLGVENTADAARLFLALEGADDPHGGFAHLPKAPRADEWRPVADPSGVGAFPLGAADQDRSLHPVQTMSIIGRVVIGTIIALSLLVAAAEGLNAVLS